MNQFKHDYGLVIPMRLGKRALEAFAYSIEHSQQFGGLGAYEHFRRYIALTWPDVISDQYWHPWTEWRLKTFCDPLFGVKRKTTGYTKSGMPITEYLTRGNVYTGCAASGKTHDIALIALAWWSVNPHESSVILCSTSKTMIRRRAWATIQKLYNDAIDAETGKRVELGYMLDSQITLQAKKGDSKHAIAAFAVEPGELQASIGKAKGMHSRRLMLVVDEADASPAAIFELATNFKKGCAEFVLLVAANAVSPLDAHGQISEPPNGWESINVEAEEWLSKGVDKWTIDPCACLHFDGEKSPNVRLGRTKWPFLYSYEDYLSAKSRPDYVQSVQYWAFERGWWAPEGAVDRVVTPQKIIRHQGRERFKWSSRYVPCAGLDPAFGGNSCVLQFGTLGDSYYDKDVLELNDVIEILPKAVSDMPVDLQVARRTIQECKARGVHPRYFGMDETGTGRGVAALIAMEWNNDFVRVNFGGQATDQPLSSDSTETARDLYQNRVTELWFRLALLLESGKLRGMHDKVCKELCSRPFVRLGRKIQVLPKEKCKSLQGKSPDFADAAVVLVEVARQHGVIPRITPRPSVVSEDEPVKKFADLVDEAWATVGGAQDRVTGRNEMFGVPQSERLTAELQWS